NFIGVERAALKGSWGEPGTVAFLNPPYSKITPWIEAAIREQTRGVTTIMLIPQSLDTRWYERAAGCANETIILSCAPVSL
ncbi:phage N-6-adenine-methyltransferase, partial [Escherichia coli]|nr:phage N-6-adenine-methyltransferase [Escherichia coli]